MEDQVLLELSAPLDLRAHRDHRAVWDSRAAREPTVFPVRPVHLARSGLQDPTARPVSLVLSVRSETPARLVLRAPPGAPVTPDYLDPRDSLAVTERREQLVELGPRDPLVRLGLRATKDWPAVREQLERRDRLEVQVPADLRVKLDWLELLAPLVVLVRMVPMDSLAQRALMVLLEQLVLPAPPVSRDPSGPRDPLVLPEVSAPLVS